MGSNSYHCMVVIAQKAPGIRLNGWVKVVVIFSDEFRKVLITSVNISFPGSAIVDVIVISLLDGFHDCLIISLLVDKK